ncbi:MAG: hypothetical protein AAGN66_09400 [Acidobacteriota bacterium]
MEKLWSKTEIAHLKRHAATQSLEELAQKFHTEPEVVRSKIEELHLDTRTAPVSTDEAALEHFSKAIELLHKGSFKEAAEGFEKALTETDSSRLIDRTRQYLAVCHAQLEESSGDEDPYLKAVFQKNRGDLDSALELCLGQGDAVEKDEKFAYLTASVHALAEKTEEALEHLTRAIQLEPKNRVHAFHDPDFESLRQDEGFSSLIGQAS